MKDARKWLMIAACGACSGEGTVDPSTDTGQATTSSTATPTSTTPDATTTTDAAPTTADPDPSTTTIAASTAGETTTGETTAGESTAGDPPNLYTYDLDLDGARESDLALGPCGANVCLLVTSAQHGDREFVLTSVKIYGQDLRPIGKHFPGDLQAVAVYYYDDDLRVATAVVDINGPGAVAYVAAPPYRSLYDTWYALVRGPGDLLYPFIAPGAGYIPPGNMTPPWTFLCQFSAATIAAPDPACGTGFRAVSTLFTAQEATGFANPDFTYRHQGGWLDDVDADGWDDIHLPYLWILKTVSGQTGASLAATYADVAQTEPNVCPGFHSGRNYGSFTTFTTAQGKRGVLVASGLAVGTFTDFFCNVSRFHAVYAGEPGLPATRSLTWSVYHGFVKNCFQQPYDPDNPVVLRDAEELDGCVHRFGDALVPAGDKLVTAYNYFTADPVADECIDEQYAEILSNFDPAAAAAWNLCAEANFLPGLGSWSVHVLDVESGGGVNSYTDAYAWGEVDTLVPGGVTTLLVEPLPGKVRFDQVGHVPAALLVYSLAGDFTWQPHGQFPVAGRPVVSYFEPRVGGTGASYYGIPVLTLADRDGDGLDDVQMVDGTWVGHDAASQTFVVKP
jgi:hypothetical protein